MKRSNGYLICAIFAVLLGVNVPLASCTSVQYSPTPISAAPVAPNESLVTAEVLETRIVDSLSLNVFPQQPIVVLKLKILSVKPAADLPSFLEGRSGETISAYSKDRRVADLTNKTVVVTVSFQGDERGGSFWVRTVSAQSSR